MADVKELFPYSYNNGGSDVLEILAYYGNNLTRLDAGTGITMSIPETDNDGNATKISATPFLGNLYVFSKSFLPFSYKRRQSATNRYYDGTRPYETPLATISKEYGARIYLADVRIADYPTTLKPQLRSEYYYNNRVFYSNLPVNNEINWGFASMSGAWYKINGKRLYVVVGEGFTGIDFIKAGIKVGDPVYVYGDKQYTVESIISPYEIRFTENATNSEDLVFWVGSNWFDVNTEDNDYITALEVNNNRLLIFKRNSLHRYDGSSLVTIKGVPGTTSKKSVINIRDYTLYYHSSNKDKTGFYMYDGVTSTRISNSIQPFINGITAATEPVAWREGEVYRAYVGDISNTNSSNPAYNISKSKVVLSYSITQNKWTIDTIADTVKSACTFIEGGVEKTIIGTDASEVHQTPSGNSFNGSNITFRLETPPYYPRGSEIMCKFTRIKIVSRDARGVHVMYKLWDTPLAVDDEYYGLGDIENDTTEFLIPTDHNRGCGIQLLFMESGQTEPNYHIEKKSIYHDSDIIQTPERKDQR